MKHRNLLVAGIIVLLIAVFSAFGWERTYFEGKITEFNDVLILPDSTFVF